MFGRAYYQKDICFWDLWGLILFRKAYYQNMLIIKQVGHFKTFISLFAEIPQTIQSWNSYYET